MNHPPAFALPILVKTTVAGRGRVVADVRVAAETMLTWPAKARRTRSYKAAGQALVQALEGEGEVEAARQSFIVVAKEVGVFLREVPLRGLG